jgi:hypothetical protein
MYAQALEVALTVERQPYYQMPSKRLAGTKYTERVVKAAVVLGCSQMPAKHYKGIVRAAALDVFRAGGALKGPVAMHLYANMLGIQWSRGICNIGNIETNSCLVAPLGVDANIKRGQFDEFLLEDTQQVVVTNGCGYVLANVVHPARFIIYELVKESSKASMSRAEHVLAIMMDQRPYELKCAFDDFARRYPNDEVWAKVRKAESSLPDLQGPAFLLDGE